MYKNIIIIFFSFLGVLLSSQQIPILGFIGVPENHTNSENYTKMKNAGFSISLTTFSSHQKALKALGEAKKAGIKIILAYPELYSKPHIVVPEIKNHSALEGYFIGDEPAPKDFIHYTKFAEKIRTYDSTHIFYVNLFPNYASSESIEMLKYDSYISLAVEKLPISFISFDHYALVNNKIRDNFYENLEIIRRVSQQSNIPFWGFACSTIHFDYLKPELSGVKLQQFGNLLYGAQGLQYFTYWTMMSDPNWKKNNYSYSIVDDKGSPTPTYNIVRTVNQQIQRLAWVFLGAKSDALFHTGNEIPQGTSKLMSVPNGFKYLSTDGKNALVSLMSNGKNKFIIFQNKSLLDDLTLDYQLTKQLKIVDNASGKTKRISASKKYKSVILPGDVLIFMYDI